MGKHLLNCEKLYIYKKKKNRKQTANSGSNQILITVYFLFNLPRTIICRCISSKSIFGLTLYAYKINMCKTGFYIARQYKLR